MMAKFEPQSGNAWIGSNETATAASDRIMALTAEIVTAWVSANNADPTMLPGLIRDVRQTLESLTLDGASVPSPAQASRPSPAVDPRRSVFDDHVVCLECGREMSSLRRHLNSAHGLTPERYRQKWGLPAGYPIVAPDYATLRSTMAKASGLGRRGGTRR
jgi:predicted transcriptional regulator